MFPKTFDHSKKDKDAEEIHGSGGSTGSDRQINVTPRVKSGKRNYSGTQINGAESISASARKSYSSSSSESSSGDSFRMDASKFTAYGASNPASKHGISYVSSSESSAKSEVDNNPLVSSPSFQVYNVIHNQKGMSPTASPPIQVMDRSGGYDSSRIPSSVFERITSPLEWSVASNESLFSLHIGNVSFSRENAFVNGELGMPGELTKSGELSLFSRPASVIVKEIYSARIEDIDAAGIEEIDTATKSDEVGNLQMNEISDVSFKLEERASEDQDEIKDILQAENRELSKTIGSTLSHSSGTSPKQSLAFPVKKRARPFCYCSNCSWAFCYRWNCSHTKCCGHASPVLTEAERDSPVETDISRQILYKRQESEATRKSTTSCWSCSNCCNWFHCFSCPSCTCRKLKPCCRWKPSCKCCKCCC